MAYLVKAVLKADLTPAIEVAVSRYRELVALEAEVESVRGRRWRPKAHRPRQGSAHESTRHDRPEAFAWIQRAAMDRRTTMKQVAVVVIENVKSQPRFPRMVRR